MKKLIFALLALFMVSAVVVSCDNKKSKKDKEEKEEVYDTPEEELLALMDDAVSIMEDTHIKSADDVKDLADEMRPIKENVERAMKELMETYKDKDPQELEELSKELEDEFKEITRRAEREGERLQTEAAEAGVDISELEDLDLF